MKHARLGEGDGQWLESGSARGGEVAYMEASMRVCVWRAQQTRRQRLHE